MASGFSANLRGLLEPFHISLPQSLSNSLGTDGGIVDLLAAIVVIITAVLLYRGTSEAARVQNALVILKVLAIFLFIIVGLSVIDIGHYIPFIPEYRETAAGAFGGWQGIYAGSSVIFVAYIGFDSIASNSGEAINPQKQCHEGFWALY